MSCDQHTDASEYYKFGLHNENDYGKLLSCIRRLKLDEGIHFHRSPIYTITVHKIAFLGKGILTPYTIVACAQAKTWNHTLEYKHECDWHHARTRGRDWRKPCICGIT